MQRIALCLSPHSCGWGHSARGGINTFHVVRHVLHQNVLTVSPQQFCTARPYLDMAVMQVDRSISDCMDFALRRLMHDIDTWCRTLNSHVQYFHMRLSPSRVVAKSSTETTVAKNVFRHESRVIFTRIPSNGSMQWFVASQCILVMSRHHDI